MPRRSTFFGGYPAHDRKRGTDEKICEYLYVILALVNIMAVSSVCAKEKLVFSTFENSGLTLLQEPILREVYKQMGIEIEIRQYPAERALRTADEGKVDGEVARLAMVQETYRNLIMIPVPLHHLKNVAFAKDVRFPVQGYESLKPYKVVTLRGYKYYDFTFDICGFLLSQE